MTMPKSRNESRCLAILALLMLMLACGTATLATAAEDQDGTSLTYPEQVERLRKSHRLSPEVAEEIRRLDKLHPQKTTGAPKYRRSGHQYTTYIVAYLAGLDTRRAHVLSYFSQYPDDEIRFSATMASVYVWDLAYRRQIMAVLHSLHGGGHQAVLERRGNLKALVSHATRADTLTDPQLGLVVHAFADSYSHVKGSESNLRAFSYVYGHLFHGHEPDVIAYAPDRYKTYACDLYLALAADQTACEPVLSRLVEMIDGLSVARDDELPKFERYAAELQFDETLYESEGAKLSQNFGKEQVVETIEAIDQAIR